MTSLEKVIETAMQVDRPLLLDRALYPLLNRLLNIQGYHLAAQEMHGEECKVHVRPLTPEFAES
jgi:hypothetical protein